MGNTSMEHYIAKTDLKKGQALRVIWKRWLRQAKPMIEDVTHIAAKNCKKGDFVKALDIRGKAFFDDVEGRKTAEVALYCNGKYEIWKVKRPW